jgi:DNA polymerase elongation subunit (family B)
MYPYPIKLKYEKVYKELILLSKKRYAGNYIENEGDILKFESKGMHIIRKDGCQIVGKI